MTAQFGVAGGKLGGAGGEGGDGGNAGGGASSLVVDNSIVNFVGRSIIVDQNIGATISSVILNGEISRIPRRTKAI